MVATPIPTIAVMTDESLTLSQRVEKWTWQLCRALEGDYEPVSYTHLTLPTIYSV